MISSEKSDSMALSIGSRDLQLIFTEKTIQMKIQKMESSEFSKIHSLAVEKLNIPKDMKSVQYYQITPTHTIIDAKLKSDGSQFYLWDSLKNHWHLLHSQSDEIIFENTKSGLLIQAFPPDYNFSVPFALAGACFFIILIGSIILFHFQPQEYTKLTRAFNEYILRRPIWIISYDIL